MEADQNGGAHEPSTTRLGIAICWVQGLYFLATGLWPLLDIRSFQAVTGKKTDHLVTGNEADHWLVNCVAALVIANSVVLIAAAVRRRVSMDVGLLGVASAVALTAIDVIYVFRNVIPSVYLLDAVAEVLLIGCWCVHFRRQRAAQQRQHGG